MSESIRITCSGCGSAYNVDGRAAGRSVQCPKCGGMIAIPSAPGPAGGAAATPAQAAPAAGIAASAAPPPVIPQAFAPPPPYSPVASDPARVASNIRLAGIFNIIVGILSLLWAVLMLIETFVAPFMAKEDPHGPPPGLMVVIFLLLFLISVGAGVVQLIAGIRLDKCRKGSRTIGLVSGFASCASILWGCCICPFCVASGIYTLILLFKEPYKAFLSSSSA